MNLKNWSYYESYSKIEIFHIYQKIFKEFGTVNYYAEQYDESLIFTDFEMLNEEHVLASLR